MPGAQTVRVAVLDMNRGTKNLGIPSIIDILDEVSAIPHLPEFQYEVFDVRVKDEVPDLSFDVYISSGGPGSPFAGKGKRWEARYFNWVDRLWSYNTSSDEPKHALFICHSFEMMCDFFGLAAITQRHSPSFGIFPVHLDDAGLTDPLFENLETPFWGADFRKWQAIEPDEKRMNELDAKILAREKVRPHVPLERALMAIRVGRGIVGVQFHPEAAPDGMLRHFRKRDRKRTFIEEHGSEKFDNMLALLRQPSPLEATRRLVIPNFLADAVSPMVRLEYHTS